MLKTIDVIKKFNLKISNMDSSDLEREITAPALHRYGLELSAVMDIPDKPRNVIGWGTKESKWFKNLGTKELREKINSVVSKRTPLVILSSGFSKKMAKIVIEICNKHKTPVHHSESHLTTVNMTIGWYIAKSLAENITIHASLVIVNGVGVMITGKSGIGKSEAVLELVQKGHYFVSDDNVVLSKIGTDFIGKPSKITKDFLEARGIGFINIPKIYGLKSTKEYVKVDLVIELLSSDELNNVDRLGNRKLYYEALGGKLDKMQIPVENGRTLSALIEAAANVYIAKKVGQEPLSIISERSK
ncbi:MAG: HPr(Ser) kinase/phosphatase [Mycoplasmatales bacterium]|nr:HPr(Ser) kinase/phosphatase [Mycoplasmatales bacterium]